MPGPAASLGSLAELADYLRARLGDLTRLGVRATSVPLRPDSARDEGGVLISPAAAPFATSSYARARLLRQLYACGLLVTHEPAPGERRPDAVCGVAR